MTLYQKRVYLQEQNKNIKTVKCALECMCEKCFGGIIPIFKSRSTLLYSVISMQQGMKERLNWSRYFTSWMSA